MSSPNAEPSCAPAVEEVAQLLVARGWTAAAAESLTGGLLCSSLARGPDAAAWFRGGLVAYASDVKHGVLGVPEGPVVNEPAARHMARGIAAMLSAHCAVAVTGAGGPNGQDGAEPGTVCFAWRIGDDELARTEHFPGSAEEVCAQTCQLAVVTLRDLLRAVR